MCLVAGSWYASTSLRNFYLHQATKDLEARARLLETQFLELIDPLDEEGIEGLCGKIGRSASTRVTVILPSGRVAGDTDEDPITMDNHANRSEIKVALKGQVGTSTRYSRTVGKKIMYLAIPLVKENRNLAVIRVSIPVIGVDEAIRGIQKLLLEDWPSRSWRHSSACLKGFTGSIRLEVENWAARVWDWP